MVVGVGYWLWLDLFLVPFLVPGVVQGESFLSFNDSLNFSSSIVYPSNKALGVVMKKEK